VTGFVDTSVLVSAAARDDTTRAPIAHGLIEGLMTARAFHTSVQVLQELYTTLTRKGRRPLSAEEALRYVDRIAAYPVVSLDYRAVRDAAQLSARETLSFRDAQIIVAAARAGASRLYSADLAGGRTVLGVEIVNPFRAH
jgi:predicted nucleic acid-binding protein